ncbi:MAG: hypothetical protein ACYS47_13625 [Planctomycetota bacterium]|jgi:DNA-directed RNA polymerase subunit M/transcription elongation factor TFIIS
MKIDCHKCKQVLFIKKCPCGNTFILTNAHVENRQREFTDKPLEESQLSAVVTQTCDACRAKEAGEQPFSVVNKAMRQKTCPKCHTETLSYYDLH